METSYTSEVQPHMGWNLRRRIECTIGTSHVTDALEHMRINNQQFSILEVLKHSIFPRLAKHNPLVDCEYRGLWAQTHYLIGPGPAHAHRLACHMKRQKAALYIKTTREPTRRYCPRTCLGSRVPQPAILPHMERVLWMTILEKKSPAGYLSTDLPMSKSHMPQKH